jgi:two-component system, NarL family, nitrate/nitrite response regulator NarL
VDTIVPTFILESDGLFRDGLRLILSRTRFRPQSCGGELEHLTPVPTDVPTVFIVGVGRKHGLVSKLRTIRNRYPLSLIVALGDEGHRKYMTSALSAGANAVLCASVTASSLVSSLHAVMSGAVIVIDARLWPVDIPSIMEEPASLLAGKVAPPETEDEPLAAKQLSAREIAILERIVRGDSNKHVARFFEIAEATVKAHVKAIFRKIGTTNRTQAAIWALNHGLFEGLNGVAEDISVLHQREADAVSESKMTAIKHAGQTDRRQIPSSHRARFLGSPRT